MYNDQCLLRAFDKWNPLSDKVSLDQPPCFIDAVEGAQDILKDRTLEELKKGLVTIDWIIDVWWDRYNECELDELKKQALAGDEEALKSCEVIKTPVGGLTVKVREAFEEGFVVPCYIPQPRGTYRDFMILREALPHYKLDSVDFPAKKSYEFYALLCLAKAAQAMELSNDLFDITSNLPGAPLTKLRIGVELSPAPQNGGRNFTHREYKMIRDKEFLVVEAIEAYHYAELLMTQGQGTAEPLMDGETVNHCETAIGKAAIKEKQSLNGQLGAIVANTKRAEIKAYTKKLYYEGWQKKRWRSPLAAANDLLPKIREEVVRIHANCLNGMQESALHTLYIKYILPYHKYLEKEKSQR